MTAFRKSFKFGKKSKQIEENLKKLDDESKKTGAFDQKDIIGDFSENNNNTKFDWKREFYSEKDQLQMINLLYEERQQKLKEAIGEEKIKIAEEVENIREVVEKKKELKQLKRVDEHLSNIDVNFYRLRDELVESITYDMFPNIPEIEEKLDNIFSVYGKLNKRISEGFLNEPMGSSQGGDPLSKTDFVTFDQLKQHYSIFLDRISTQLASLGGGGETQLMYLDDVVGIATNPSVYDGKYLKYSHAIRKFVFSDVGTIGITTEIQNLNNVLGLGNTSNLGINVGVSTFNGVTVGGATTALLVQGNVRVIGILTVGSGTVVIDGTNNIIGIGTASLNEVKITQLENLTGQTGNFGGNVNIVGVITANKISASSSITATSFYGNGSNLTGLNVGVGTTTISTNSIVVSGIVTSNSFVKVGGSSTQFLKADGSVDNSTYLTSYTEISTLNNVLSRADNTSTGMVVGVITASSFSGTATSAIYATTSGTSINSNIAGYASTAGIASVSQALTGTPNIVVANVTAVDASFSGNVSIAGTLSYVSLVNLDSVGVITARSGILIGNPTSIGATITALGNAIFSGIVTATSFSGNATSSTYATTAGTATYAISSGIATYATNSGVSTYASSSGIATYATLAGIATYAISSGIATYATNSGVSTYASSSGIATYATNSGVSTYATSSGIATYATSAGIATYANNSGVSTYATSSGIATYATSAGIATYATSAGYVSYATTAGISTSAQSLIGSPNIVVGLVTANYAQISNIRIATYGTNNIFGVSGPLYLDSEWGQVDIVNSLNVNGIGTFKNRVGFVSDLVGLSSAIFVGVVTAQSFKGDGSGLTGIAVSISLNDLTDVNAGGPSTGQVLKWSGTEWNAATDLTAAGGSGIGLTDLSVTVNSSGISTLTYNNTTGIFSYTPPNLSSYLTSSISQNVLMSNGYVFTYDSSAVARFGVIGIGSIPNNNYGDIFWGTSGGVTGFNIENKDTDGGLYLTSVGSNGVVIRSTSSKLSASFVPNGESNLYYDNILRLSTTGVGVTVFGELRINSGVVVSGIVTANEFKGTFTGAVSFASVAGVASTATYATSSVTAITASNLTGTPNLNVGVITATSFVGNITGSSSFASVSGIASALLGTININTTGIITASGGINAPFYIDESEDDDVNYNIPFFDSVAGGDTYRLLQVDNGGLQFNPFLNTLIVSNVSATNYSGSGVNLTGIVTSIVAGIGVTVSNSTGSVTITATSVGIATYATSAGIATYATSAGIATYASSAGIATYATNAGIATNAQGLTGTPNLNVGIITATNFVGNGSGLTGIIASGSGVIVKDSGTVVGTAGTIDFGDNLTVSAISAGIVTVTGSAGGGSSSQFVTTAAGIHTLSNVGVGTTNPISTLQVNRYGVSSGFGTFIAQSGIEQIIDQFNISTNNFKTSEYTIHIEHSSGIHAQKVLVMQNGVTAYSNEYSIMYTTAYRLVSVGSTVSSGTCQLKVTPESGVTGITTYRFSRETLL